MKNILLLRYMGMMLVGLLLTVPITLYASNYGKQSNLKYTFLSQAANLTANNSGNTLTISALKNANTSNNLPKIKISNPFPNPASSFVKINYKFPSANDSGELRIMDLTGKTVKTYSLEGTNNSLRINISDLTRGLYFCALYYKGQLIKSDKLIVSNR